MRGNSLRIGRFCGGWRIDHCRRPIRDLFCWNWKEYLWFVICERVFRLNWKEQSEDSHVSPWLCRNNPIGIWQLSRRGDFVSGPHFVKIAKSVLKSRFCAISSDFCDFTRFQPDFTHFRFFQAIQPVMHVLTRKIVWFYESKRDFNNFVCECSVLLAIYSYSFHEVVAGCLQQS